MKGLSRSTLAVVGIGSLMAIVVACGARQPQPPPGLNDAQLAGWQVYVGLDCATCHGNDREGLRAGPRGQVTLEGIQALLILKQGVAPASLVRQHLDQ